MPAASPAAPDDQCAGEAAGAPLGDDEPSFSEEIRVSVVEYVRTFHATAKANVAIRTVKNAGRKDSRRIS